MCCTDFGGHSALGAAWNGSRGVSSAVFGRQQCSDLTEAHWCLILRTDGQRHDCLQSCGSHCVCRPTDQVMHTCSTLAASVSKPSKAALAGTLKACEEALHTSLVACKSSFFSADCHSHSWRVQPRAHATVHLTPMCMEEAYFCCHFLDTCATHPATSTLTEFLVLISGAQHSTLFFMTTTCKLSPCTAAFSTY